MWVIYNNDEEEMYYIRHNKSNRDYGLTLQLYISYMYAVIPYYEREY